MLCFTVVLVISVCVFFLLETVTNLRANEILSGNVRKNYLFECCPGNGCVCFLCEKH